MTDAIGDAWAWDPDLGFRWLTSIAFIIVAAQRHASPGAAEG